jgi:hypothetical protein
MDRLAGLFMDSHPENQFTSNFPLQPFLNNGKDISYTEPRRWIYTTVGDMAKDTRALGYMYAPPYSPDAFTPQTVLERDLLRPTAVGGRAISLPEGVSASTSKLPGDSKDMKLLAPSGNGAKNIATTRIPHVVFPGIGCTDRSYRVDVFVSDAKSLTVDPVKNPDFIGHITRLGMGPADIRAEMRNTDRCRKPEATRVLRAEKHVDALRSNSSVKLVVTDIETGKELSKAQYGKLPGFDPIVLWLL